MYRGEVRVVVDEQDDLFSTRVALQAHRPAEGCITVQPTPASALPAALAHDVLYALGKRLAPASGAADALLDSVKAAWLAAAAWSVAEGIRHVVLLRAHLLTTRRVEQLLAWRDMAGIHLTLVWQAAPRRIPPALAPLMHRVSSREQFEAVLSGPGPVPAYPAYSPGPGSPGGRRGCTTPEPSCAGGSGTGRVFLGGCDGGLGRGRPSC
ncbi:hypothetical protein [Streptomyces violaceusniger]|uniref:Uncharacterized protein n=1 Tax=Streptomyces violaceusniger (strain Tu 4113) TaxID=653045 RepID=G2PFC0_STRV4|nr:hypothetical protein [Streptomyces violaceusniger]AEM84263.1 hypothetical protein Strvi_4680 [Streptomyces violaceusniger Tu 4113]